VRVHIISDMEGISGIVHTEQTNAGKPMFEEGRKLYTEEINAAVRGAKAGGAAEIVVMDCHGAGDGFSWNSLIAEELDPDCEFVVQDQWTGYTAFLESGCDAALFVGMHAMAGTSDGVLNHTVSGVDWQNLWFNGTRVGETGINAGEGLTTVEVKEGLGAKTARLLPPRRARELVEAGAKRALSDLKAVAPYDPGKPCEVKVEYKGTTPPQRLRFQSGVELLDDRTIVSRGDDWWTAWKQFFFAAG